jgi:hypothetical protein
VGEREREREMLAGALVASIKADPTMHDYSRFFSFSVPDHFYFLLSKHGHPALSECCIIPFSPRPKTQRERERVREREKEACHSGSMVHFLRVYNLPYNKKKYKNVIKTNMILSTV